MDSLYLPTLSPEIQQKIVSFLPSVDAVRFTQSSKSQREALHFSSITHPILSSIGWYGGYHDGDTSRRFLEIPMLLRSRIHSVVIRCGWKDQGWGNRKGEIFVEECNGKVVCSSGLAPHSLDELELTFHVKTSRTYSLCYKVGAGGGHELLVQNLEIQYIFFDEPGLYLSRHFRALSKHNALQINSFWFRFLLSCCQSMINQAENLKSSIDPFLSDFLETAGIAVNVSSLESLVELCFSLENEKLPDELSGLRDASDQYADEYSDSSQDGILWGY